MKFYSLKSIVISIALLVGALGIPMLSFAQQGSFVVRPAKIELEGKPGETVKATITLTNNLGTPATFKISFEDITAGTNPEDDVSLLGEKRGPFPMRDLMRGPARVSLVNGQETKVPISINIPKDASVGGLYGSVIFSPERGPELGNLIPDSRIGVLVFLKVAGESREEGKLLAFSPFNNTRMYFGIPTPTNPLKAQIVYENTGTVHVNPYGKLTYKSWGNLSGEIQIDPWYVLPQSTRMRELTLSNTSHYGRNTFTLELNRGYNDIVDIETFTIWIFPSGRTIIVSTLLILTLGYFAVRRGRRITVL